MSMLVIKSKGSFKNTFTLFKKWQSKRIYNCLDKYGREGVAALAAATPVDTGKTASSWGYKIVETEKSTSLIFNNTNVVDGVPVAIVIEYGHVTPTGGYVEGVDYINPALQPIFNKILKDVWKEVTD